VSSSPTPFAWVHKRDGRLVPFDADRISRALFAAGESLGRPDAFASRELTDSILHFLRAEASGATPTTAQIAELVVKVVRELGQPALAKAFADAQTRKAESGKQAEEDQRQAWKGSAEAWETRPGFGATPGANLGPTHIELAQWVDTMPSARLARRAAGACLRDFALRNIYQRDLVAVQADGLLSLAGLDSPLELAAGVLRIDGAPASNLVEIVEEARSLVGEYVALDGPEYSLARTGMASEGVGRLVRELAIGLRLTHLQAVVNLNIARPPAWAGALAEGPLFEQHLQGPPTEQTAELLEQLVQHLLVPGVLGAAGRIDWHLNEGDFGADNRGGFLRLARRALEEAPLAFVLDRPRRPVALAEGLDRQHPAVLLTVGLHLPRLLEQCGPPIDPQLFLRKLDSLARLALSAATQKREFLRRHGCGRPNVHRGFVLDRARLLAVPVGLDHVTQTLFGRGLGCGGSSCAFAQQLVQRLQKVLEEDARAHMLDIGVDSALGYRLFSAGQAGDELWAGSPQEAAGLTPWDPTATAKNQLVAAAPLHAAAGAGTVALFVAEDRPMSPEELVDLLRFAWQQTEVIRVRIVRAIPQQRQLTAPWERSGQRA
jgi:hypothetical protein